MYVVSDRGVNCSGQKARYVRLHFQSWPCTCHMLFFSVTDTFICSLCLELDGNWSIPGAIECGGNDAVRGQGRL